MPFDARVLSVLIASPGDVRDARDAIESELHEWNSAHSAAWQVTLQPRRWETDGVPLLARGDAQSVLNEEVVDEADIVIGVFHTRLGSPTMRAASGTAEELERSAAAGKPVHVWFSEQPLPYGVNEDQLSALRVFREALESQNLVGTFTSDEELRAKVRRAVDYDIAHRPGSTPTQSRARSLRPIGDDLAETQGQRPQTEADLEIYLRWQQSEERFEISLSYRDASRRLDHIEHDPVYIDSLTLKVLPEKNADAYGRALSRMVFSAERVRTFYARVGAVVHLQRELLHLHLHLDLKAPIEYHLLHWETLLDPVDERPIAITSGVKLSRYLPTVGWRSLTSDSRRDPRVLVVIASPTDISEYEPGGTPLQPADVSEQLKWSRAMLGEMTSTELTSGVTVDSIFAALESDCDVLYLRCHLCMISDETVLYLEDREGFCHTIRGAELAGRFAELITPPSLAVLMPLPRMWDRNYESALGALALQISAAGVASVLAIQPGVVTVETTKRFLTEFFRAYRIHGTSGQAAALARRAVRQRSDWWGPVLFSR